MCTAQTPGACFSPGSAHLMCSLLSLGSWAVAGSPGSLTRLRSSCCGQTWQHDDLQPTQCPTTGSNNMRIMPLTATSGSVLFILALFLCSAWSQTPVERCGINNVTKESYNHKCSIKGHCCSGYGYCDSKPEYCDTCQEGYGYCPVKCDANAAFCGPAPIATFVLALLGALISILGAAVAVVALVKTHFSGKPVATAPGPAPHLSPASLAGSPPDANHESKV